MKIEVLDALPTYYADLVSLDQTILYKVKNKHLVLVFGDRKHWVAIGNTAKKKDCLDGTKSGLKVDALYQSHWTIWNHSDLSEVLNHTWSCDKNNSLSEIEKIFQNDIESMSEGKIQLGVELELEGKLSTTLYQRKASATMVRWAKDFLYDVKSDVSVSYGAEICFRHPSLDNWDMNIIKDVLRSLKRKGFSHASGTAGMHIHISAPTPEQTQKAVNRALRDQDWLKDYVLYPICARQLYIRGQEQRSLNRYGLGSNWTRGYTRYQTFEVRVWEATLNPEVFMGRLKFADYFMKFLLSDLPIEDFFDHMNKEDKLNYKMLLETENPHVFGIGKDAALKQLKLEA